MMEAKKYPIDTPRTNAFEKSGADYRKLANFARNLEREAHNHYWTLRNILDGNYPHAVRAGKCDHDKYWYEDCEQCIESYITRQLGNDIKDATMPLIPTEQMNKNA